MIQVFISFWRAKFDRKEDETVAEKEKRWKQNGNVSFTLPNEWWSISENDYSVCMYVFMYKHSLISLPSLFIMNYLYSLFIRVFELFQNTQLFFIFTIVLIDKRNNQQE